MAIGPKGGRKRVSKRGEKKDKNVEQSVEETTSVDSESSDKKSAAALSPIFQAAPTTVAPARSKKSEASEDSDSDDEKNHRQIGRAHV